MHAALPSLYPKGSRATAGYTSGNASDQTALASCQHNFYNPPPHVRVAVASSSPCFQVDFSPDGRAWSDTDVRVR